MTNKEMTNDAPSQKAHMEQQPLSDEESITLQEQAVIRKVDWRLIPILGALYSISLIDRVNISSARIAGMEKELRLDIGNRYSIALLVFFIPYLIFEGFITNYASLIVCRLFVGFFESGFFPGCVYLISCWYARYEVQKRLAAFYLSAVLVGGFSGILAFGLMQLQGVRGYLGWRWIFIIEGLITQLIAIFSWFFIVDFPHNAQKTRFLTAQEADLVQLRIDKDRQDAGPDPLTIGKIGKHLCDWKLWMFSLMLMATTAPVYAFAFFSPVIIKSMGYSAGISNLLIAPPYVFAVASAYVFACFGDKWRMRGPIIVIQSLISITGLLLIAQHPNNDVRYFGLFIGIAGCQGNIPALLAHQSNNIRMQSKRAVGTALQVGFGAIGGIIGSTTFRQADAPRYVPGLWVSTGLLFVVIGLLGVTEWLLWKRNKEIDEGKAKEPIEGLQGFKYTL
ncbi:predicted protein [Uncinocarpus reesii 1704]|uniref:Major facilitator superfamily (MFS) profile domain-containing protein n=1 Tax=Uncinocarpus reesii (strain UAMH 1704) TaxID=336963 RepID=C4JRI1_UNCRE|nr:uncharacterized protein UREG_05070 [Uncinocarpus reesii 1704]EEP80228.1 predicted protein [Uncinocarpus reesii 1704]